MALVCRPDSAAEAEEPLAHRSRLRAQLVQLDAATDQGLAPLRVAGEGGDDVVGGKRVREDPDPDAAVDQLLQLGDTTVERDEVGRFDQELGLQPVEALVQHCVHHAQARVVDRGGIVEHDVRGGPDEAADEGRQLRRQARRRPGRAGADSAPSRSPHAMRCTWSRRSASPYGRSTSAAIGTDHSPFQNRSKTLDRSRTTGPPRRCRDRESCARRVHLEVRVAHVAPADDCHRVVHHHQLVVHAVIDAIEVDQEAEQARPAMREGIEQADLDVRVRVERGDRPRRGP